MILQEFLNEDQVNLCEETGIIIEDRDYCSLELYEIEKKIIEYINENCMDEKFYLLEEKFDEILDIIMDLENDSEDIAAATVEVNENDHIELNNGKTGWVIDITNGAYTIEVDEDFKTGNLDEDVIIVAQNSIVGVV